MSMEIETAKVKNSIYQTVKNKLLTHGVCKIPDGKIILSDKTLFLKFVMLERAVRFDDFDSVQTAVQDIEEHCESIGKIYLVLFAYMYLLFSDAAPNKTHEAKTLEDGRWRRIVDYRREVTPNERLIGDWASIWYKRYSSACFRACSM